MLTIEQLVTSYGGIQALRGVSLTVPEGAMVALIGPNGAGKTTMLNTLSGIVRPRSGRVLFQEQDLVGLAPHRIARAGLLQVPEGRQVLASMSVEENLELGRLASRTTEAADLGRVYELFPVLRERRRQDSGSLSGGQQQMLAIGRALMANPKLLLLDEPSLGLAPLIVSQVFDALVQLNRGGLTILLVEQNARRALEMTQYAYVLEQGRIVREGASADLARDSQIASHYLGRAAVTLQAGDAR